MKTIGPLLIFLFCCWQLPAQFSFYVGTQGMIAPDWKNLFEENFVSHQSSVFSPSTYLALELDMRSKRNRFRLSSKLFLSRYLTIANNPSNFSNNPSQSNFEILFLGMAINTDWYILNFNKSLRTSTFTQEENWLKKGLFIRLTPGITISPNSARNRSSSLIDDLIFNGNGQETNLSLEAGIGLDLGISELITISPILSYTLTRDVYWRNFGLNPTTNFTGSFSNNRFFADVHHIQLALRLAFHFRSLNQS